MHTCAKKILEEQGENAYKEYLNAVKHFTQKRFDATALIDTYLPKIKEYGCQSVPLKVNPRIRDEYNPFAEFRHLCEDLEFPEIKTQTQKTVVKEIPKKQSFIDWLLRREPEIERTTETIEKEIVDYDFKNINPKLCLMPTSYGPPKFDKIYISTKDMRSRYAATGRFENYLEENHIPVYNCKFSKNPFASTAGIEHMEKLVDEYLKTHIESELNKIISKASKNQKIIQQEHNNSKIEDRISRDLSHVLE